MYQPLNCINCRHVFFIPVSSLPALKMISSQYCAFSRVSFQFFFYFDLCRTSQNVNIWQRLTHYYECKVVEALCFDLSHITWEINKAERI